MPRHDDSDASVYWCDEEDCWKNKSQGIEIDKPSLAD